MFKRIIRYFLGPKEEGGKPVPSPKPEYDFSRPFKIVVAPTVVCVPLGPIETFSARAQEMIIAELEILKKKTEKTMFHPMPDGTLRLYQPREDEQETIN